MNHSFNEFIKHHHLCTKQDRIVVALSGGIDSMVMATLFLQEGYQIVVAHCNFCLRNNESDGDEQFVRNWAAHHQVPVIVETFNTTAYAHEHKISIQMAARDLRYHFFEKIRLDNNCQYIAVAHNKNDVAETFLLNLSRGTGLQGLTGIKPMVGKIIRPLLFAARTEIETFAATHAILFREDSSNSSVKYKRNKIRHQIIPLLCELNPQFLNSMVDTIGYLQDSNILADEMMEGYKQRWLEKNSGDSATVFIEELKHHMARKTILYAIIAEFGFGHFTSQELHSVFESKVGACFYSSTHRLIVDRKSLLITPISQTDNSEYLIPQGTEEILHPIRLTIASFAHANITFTNNNNIAYFDLDKLTFPLKLRRWQAGDRFSPLGMKGEKNVSDYLTDIKLSLLEKENVWVLLSGNKIIWIVGYRTADTVKITADTQQHTKISLVGKD